MVCNVTFNPHPFKTVYFVQSGTSKKYTVECFNYPESPLVKEPMGSDVANTTSEVYRPFDAAQCSPYLTRASFAAMLWMLHLVNSHPSLETLMPGHQWQIRLISLPDYRISERGKRFSVMLELYQFEERINYDCVKLMGREYGLESCTGHELYGELV
ncbi:hypothetical protein TWF730_010526 [Orbilia blumenaviensis]|uniref:Uncharacterized protein n=1 Tax=Orbilia blumenaviensis TaxID=1796055 RepID=A0AAV9URY0_9PEZI